MLEIRTSLGDQKSFIAERNPSPKLKGDCSKSEPHQGDQKNRKLIRNPSPTLKGAEKVIAQNQNLIKVIRE